VRPASKGAGMPEMSDESKVMNAEGHGMEYFSEGKEWISAHRTPSSREAQQAGGAG